MKLIAAATVGSGGAANIEFTSIPGTYTDLLVVMSARCDRNTNPGFCQITFNGATTNQSVRRLYGDGANVTSNSENNNWSYIVPGASQTASTFSNTLIYIPNYTGSTNKSFSVDTVSENNATTAYQIIVAGLWSVTNAITSVKLFVNADNSANFVQHTVASLYGITKGSDGIVTTS
jgi:hypothetical protein